MAEEADVRHPGDIGGGAGAGDEGRKGADVEDEVRYGIGFFDFILLAGGKVQAPCAVIFRDDIVFDTEGDLQYDVKAVFIRRNDTDKLVSLTLRDLQTGRLTLID